LELHFAHQPVRTPLHYRKAQARISPIRGKPYRFAAGSWFIGDMPAA
jgi:hypothetical protein